jgi:acetyl-CoA acetyltransferase
MSEAAAAHMPPAERRMSCRAAIVGVGESDYGADYKAARAKAPGYELPLPETLAATAFERALADSGLQRRDIDGLSVSFIYGGPSPVEMAQMLQIAPRHISTASGIMAGPLPIACADIIAGKCDTIALVYAVASRAMGRQYGGTTYQGATGAPSSYYYHLPWGWSSQAAHWALMWQYYQEVYGATEADLGAVAVQIRRHAMANENAVMRAPLSVEDYLRSRYIVRPMHLFDLCLVNDGAVCLIVRRADMARDLPHAPVLVAGWSEVRATQNKIHNMVRERLRPQIQQAGALAGAMADIALSQIQHFEGYDVSTIHLINQLEGFGFAEPGAGLEFCKAGQMTFGGRLPVNTSGGQLSESYMHGWNQIVEITRQLRHEAGARQIEGVQASMFSLAQTDQVHPLIFKRGV